MRGERGWGGVRQVGSKKFKLIPTPPRDAVLKSHPIRFPPPLQGGVKLSSPIWLSWFSSINKYLDSIILGVIYYLVDVSFINLYNNIPLSEHVCA